MTLGDTSVPSCGTLRALGLNLALSSSFSLMADIGKQHQHHLRVSSGHSRPCAQVFGAKERTERERSLRFHLPVQSVSLRGLWIQTNILSGGKCVTCVLDIQMQVITKKIKFDWFLRH